MGAGLATLAIATPALGAPAPPNTLDIGDLPHGSTPVGSFKECAQTARKSVATDMDIEPTYTWPNSVGESFLTKADVSLKYNLDPVVDYSVGPSNIRDAGTEKHCAGTRTDETTIRVRASKSQGAFRIFNQIIKGNAPATVQASAEASLARACRAKDALKAARISRTQTTKYREEDKVSQRNELSPEQFPAFPATSSPSQAKANYSTRSVAPLGGVGWILTSTLS